MNNIKGLDQWEGETKEWNKQAGKLKMKAGVELVNALENWYAAWKLKKTDRNRREYMLWRLRLHLKWNQDVEFLEELNEVFGLGLHDEEVGKLLWDIEPETSTSFISGYNWRKDSGRALKGYRRPFSDEESEMVEE